jgi:hypothetical protein
LGTTAEVNRKLLPEIALFSTMTASAPPPG